MNNMDLGVTLAEYIIESEYDDYQEWLAENKHLHFQEILEKGLHIYAVARKYLELRGYHVQD